MSTDFFKRLMGASGGRRPPERKPISLEPKRPAAPRPRILIIDDDRVLLKALSLKLTTSGYDVSTATDASEAIAAVRDSRPDLFLLDIDFPPDVALGGGWDGLQIMRWLRGLSPVLHAPFIILSGCDSKQYAPEAYAGGAIAFLEKPVDSRELLQVIRNTLARRTAPGNTAPLLATST